MTWPVRALRITHLAGVRGHPRRVEAGEPVAARPHRRDGDAPDALRDHPHGAHARGHDPEHVDRAAQPLPGRVVRAVRGRVAADAQPEARQPLVLGRDREAGREQRRQRRAARPAHHHRLRARPAGVFGARARRHDQRPPALQRHRLDRLRDRAQRGVARLAVQLHRQLDAVLDPAQPAPVDPPVVGQVGEVRGHAVHGRVGLGRRGGGLRPRRARQRRVGRVAGLAPVVRGLAALELLARCSSRPGPGR